MKPDATHNAHVKTPMSSDDIARRTAPAVTGRLTLRLVETLNHQVADILGWDGARRKEEMSTLTEYLRIFHAVTLQ